MEEFFQSFLTFSQRTVSSHALDLTLPPHKTTVAHYISSVAPHHVQVETLLPPSTLDIMQTFVFHFIASTRTIHHPLKNLLLQFHPPPHIAPHLLLHLFNLMLLLIVCIFLLSEHLRRPVYS